MSISPQDGQSKSMEDCRDYLRTGRCKYGASCKYNHPSNVQNGGGVKPADPSEPLFPLRPNEPVCQYFMKHGTCKFGQACKFNHPPQSTVQMMDGTGQIHLVNVGGHRKPEPPPQLLYNSVGSDPNAQQGMMLQFLPQRPGEPECIYFLKNGRCKYGATCRYHHPVHAQQRRVDKQPLQRRPQEFYGRSAQKVQYVTQMIPNYSGQAGQQVVMSSDSSPVTIINMDGSNGNQGYQIIPGSDGVSSYCVPAGSVVVTEQGSSTSSIASSYEAHEYLNDSWNRSRRNGSNGNLNALGENRQQRSYIPHSVSDSNMQQPQRRTRSVSYGSAVDHTSSNAILESSSYSGLPRNASVGSWNQQRAPQPTNHYGGRQEQAPNGRPSVLPATHQRRLVPGMRRRGPREGQDEGFTMMTSALLHMLDTPEEAAAECYSDEEYRQRPTDQYDLQHVEPVVYGDYTIEGGGNGPKEPTAYVVESNMFEQLSLQDSSTPNTHDSTLFNNVNPSWSQNWQSPNSGGHPNDGFNIHHHAARTEGANNSDVGLYLP